MHLILVQERVNEKNGGELTIEVVMADNISEVRKTKKSPSTEKPK